MVGRNLLEHVDAGAFEFLAPTRSELDLMDREAVGRYFQRHAPDAVIHAAGTVGGIQANIRHPVRFLSDNLTIGVNVLESARACGIRNLLNLGSSCMYPRHAQNPLVEEAILTGELEPTNEGYALAKIACARLAEYISREDPDYHYRTIIPCNLYGRHDSFDPQRSHMIPAVVRKIIEAVETGADVVDVWGDGLARREFMYAGDLADFIIYALGRFHDLPQNLNVGLGHDHRILDYYHTIAHAAGFKGAFDHDMTKPSGMNQKLVSIARLEAFGWRARTTLSAGIEATIHYFQNEKRHD